MYLGLACFSSLYRGLMSHDIHGIVPTSRLETVGPASTGGADFRLAIQ